MLAEQAALGNIDKQPKDKRSEYAEAARPH
jgi:hypothetical protein